MRMSKDPTKAWLILDKKGAITAGHCTCMAGCGEVCSHVAAIAFVLQLHSQQKSKAVSEDLACTDELSKWTVPSLSKKIEPKQMKDIDWGKTITTKAFNGKFLFRFVRIFQTYFYSKIVSLQMLKIFKFASLILTFC